MLDIPWCMAYNELCLIRKQTDFLKIKKEKKNGTHKEQYVSLFAGSRWLQEFQSTPRIGN